MCKKVNQMGMNVIQTSHSTEQSHCNAIKHPADFLKYTHVHALAELEDEACGVEALGRSLQI